MNNRARTRNPKELPAALWLYWPPVMLLLLVAIYPFDKPLFTQMLAKDHEGGVVEILTVLLLLPGIYAGIRILLRWRHVLANRLAEGWVLVWTLAMIYFAGEEISWGQWFFFWETPETFARLNDQRETNLHNMSSWFDQKPRTLVELWILIAGLVLPLWRNARDRVLQHTDGLRYWILPTAIVVPTTILFVVVRVFEWIQWGAVSEFGSSELREYYIALFLSLYMLSLLSRAARVQHASRNSASVGTAVPAERSR